MGRKGAHSAAVGSERDHWMPQGFADPCEGKPGQALSLLSSSSSSSPRARSCGPHKPRRICCGVWLFRNQYGRRLMYEDILLINERRDPKAASEGKARCGLSGDRDGRPQALRILPDCSRCSGCHNCGHPVFDSRVDDGRLAEIGFAASPHERVLFTHMATALQTAPAQLVRQAPSCDSLGEVAT
jgi:hypothetical protein